MKKRVNDYPDYLVSDTGDIWSEKTKRILSGSIGENGYKYFRLSHNGVKKIHYAHRLVAQAFIENPKGYPVVNHKDGNRLNNNVDNLEWTTYSENTSHWHNSSNVVVRPREYYTEDLPNEEWKLFKKNYLVSSLGRVRSVRGNLLRPVLTGGYLKVRLSFNGLVEDWFLHKLVYSLFIDDLDPSLVIDHIDGNKINNNVLNLRQISLSDNVKAALYETKTNSSAKEVNQYTLDGEFIQTFPSTREAARHLNLDGSTISKVCRGVNKTHGGFIFKYN